MNTPITVIPRVARWNNPSQTMFWLIASIVVGGRTPTHLCNRVDGDAVTNPPRRSLNPPLLPPLRPAGGAIPRPRPRKLLRSASAGCRYSDSLELTAKLVIVRSRLLTIVITMLALCACGEDRHATPTTPTPPTGTTPPTPTPTPSVPPVRGTVVDFQTAKPMAGAVVGFAPESNSIGITQTASQMPTGNTRCPSRGSS